MPGRSAVDGGATIGRVLSHVRRHVELTHVGYEVGRVEALVGTDDPRIYIALALQVAEQPDLEILSGAAVALLKPIGVI